MPRPRNALWESTCGGVYVSQHAKGFRIVDIRYERRQMQRTTLDAALVLARSLAGQAAEGAVITFFELAVDFLKYGLTEWDDGSGQAISPRAKDDMTGRIRNHYGFCGNTPLSELPADVLDQAVKRAVARPDGAGASLRSKIHNDGHRILRYGKQKGLIPHDRHFTALTKNVRKKKLNDANYKGRALRPLPSHREVHALARTSAALADAAYMRLFWWLMAYIAFREGELCALKVENVVVDGRVRINVEGTVVTETGNGTFIQPYAKGYERRTVTVPRILEGPLLARVAEVRAAGGSLLFPMWKTGHKKREGLISYSTLRGNFLEAGETIGWEVKSRSGVRIYVDANGKRRRYASKPQSLEYTIHDLRAFGATAMYAPRSAGIVLRGMGMSLDAVASQLGDLKETVKRHYLGIIDSGTSAVLDREVP